MQLSLTYLAAIAIALTPAAPHPRAPAAFGIGMTRAKPGAVGAPISDVQPDGVAAKIGIKPRDAIVAIDGKQVRDVLDFSAMMRGYRAGDTVTFTVLRDGQQLRFTGTASAARNAVASQQVVRDAIGEIAGLLEKRYVLADVGLRYSAMLRSNLTAGAYYNLPDELSFAEKVTADLKSTFPDRHLHVAATHFPSFTNVTRARLIPDPVERLTRLTPAIAYMRFGRAPNDAETQQQVIDFIKANADARTVIIDLRTASVGGVPQLPRMILPYLFAKPTTALWQDFRKSVHDEFTAAGDVLALPGDTQVAAPEGFVRYAHTITPATDETRLWGAKVYVLTSPVTGSAWELLAMSFITTGRGIVIGETTAGRGNPGRWAPIGDDFRLLVPHGRILDPRTGKGWEGTGVQPDVRMPAPQALVEALMRSGVDRAHATALSASVGANPDAMYPLDPASPAIRL